MTIAIQQIEKQPQQRRNGRNSKRRAQQEEDNEEEDDQDGNEPEVKLIGVSPPGFNDLIVVRLVKLPYQVVCMVFCILRFIFWYKLLGKSPPPVDREQLIKERLGMSDEEWENQKRQWQERQRRGNYKRR